MTQTPFSEQQQQPKMAHTTDEFDPVHARLSPTSQVAVHIAQKGYQAGSIVGVLGVLPVSVIRAWRNNRSISAADLLRRVGISSLSGVAATALLGAAKLSQIDEEGMVDRAYRLHYNDSQRRTDLCSAVGSAVGLTAGSLLLRGGPRGALHYLGAAGAGAAAGIVAHVLTRPEEHKSPDKMLHELRSSNS